MGLDKSQFIEIFKSEAEGYLTALNQGLVKLEKTPEDSELIVELMRAAHTLKGSARMLGFTKIRDISHKIEDLFTAIRDGKLKFQSYMADAVFSALDLIEKAMEMVVNGKDEDIEIDEVVAILGDVCEGKEVKKKESTSSQPKEPVEKETASTEEEKQVEPVEEKAPEPVKSEPAKSEPSKPELTESETPDSEESSADPRVSKVKEEYIRVPLSRINLLLNLIGEIVINKVKSNYKISAMKKVTQQAKRLEKLLFNLESSVKEAMDIPDEWIQHKGSVIRASQEMTEAIELLDELHEIEALFGHMHEDWHKISDDIQTELFHINPVIDELQHKMKEIRMLPCSTIFEGFPRLVRDTARDLDKKIELVIRGEETELDKKVLEAIKGPLIHILRNAVDHGIENAKGRASAGKSEVAKIELIAQHEGGKVVILVRDDGKGLDINAIREKALKNKVVTKEQLSRMNEKEIANLIYVSGFSTAPIITDVSGRGVGLDVVRTEIERLKGTVTISSEFGQGAEVRIELPLTIAIMLVMMVQAGGQKWALPVANVEECITILPKQIKTIQNRMVVQVEDSTIPILFLADVLGLETEHPELHVEEEDDPLADIFDDMGDSRRSKELAVVIVNALNKRVGFIIDRNLGEDEVFIKYLGDHLGEIKGISGATNLASGELVVILNMRDLVEQTQNVQSGSQVTQKKASTQKKRVLVVEDSITTRELERSILENSGFEVETAIDGLDALDKLGKQTFDVIISDIQMPRMDGYDLCRAVRSNAKTRQVPFVFVTSLSKEEEKRRGVDVGAQAYIVKNQFDQTSLLETLEKVL